jgi:DNA polymerase III sliding clamp (beta) subunit (PCNA family)
MRTTICTVKANLLHEALQRAIRVAPSKGAGFDKAGGLMMETHGNGKLHIKATDLERTFFQILDAEVSMPMQFRIHTHISKFVASLPMTADQDVRFHIDDSSGRIEVQYMKSPTKIKVPTIIGEYPTVQWFDYDSMDDAFELAGKIQSVAWATEDGAVAPINGIRIDGEWIEALSSKQMARIQCKVKTDNPVIAVVKTLAPLISDGSRVRIKALEGRVVVALDETAQVTSSTVLGAWPDLSTRIDKLELPEGFNINRQRLSEALARIIAFTNGDRFPRINFVVGADRVSMSLTEAKDGDISDVMTLSSRTGSTDTEFCFNPVWLARAIDTFPGAEVQVRFANPRLPIRLIEPMTSYNALIMGLQPGEKVESPKEEASA